MALAAVIYLGWAAATWFHARLGVAGLALVGGWLIAWQGSLQHETIHGHPTPSAALNRAIGFAPLSLWLPYGVYRRSHIAHHASEALTHPAADPESRYRLAPTTALARAEIFAAPLHASLLGRLTIGPVFEVLGFWAAEARRLARGDRAAWRDWSAHALGVALILLWLHACGLGLVRYVLTFVYPGLALSLLRSFAEHRADADPRRRIAVVEAAPVLGLLFLNNNLHAAHHLRPGLAWWRLPAFYRANRSALLAGGGRPCLSRLCGGCPSLRLPRPRSLGQARCSFA